MRQLDQLPNLLRWFRCLAAQAITAIEQAAYLARGVLMPFQKVATPLLALPRGSKRLMVVALDAVLCILTVWLAFYLRLGYFSSLFGEPTVAVALSICLALPAFYVAGLYRVAFRHSGSEVVPAVALACLVYGLFYTAIISAYSLDGIPRTVGIIQPILLFLAVSLVRMGAGWLLSRQKYSRSKDTPRKRVLIYGAGSSGRQLASAISEGRDLRMIGFLDDDPSLFEARVDGFRVYPANRVSSLVEEHQIDEIFLALPSASRRRRNDIIAGLRNLSVNVRTLPGLMDLAHGRVHASDLRELSIEDLLSRDPVIPEFAAMERKISGRVVLVTGAGGSIGSELCRQIIASRPKVLLLLENSEFALYAVHRDLTKASDVMVIPLLGSVTDVARVDKIMETWSPAMVFHAAAYKHVPLVEHNPLEGLYNNVIGTWRLAEVAVRMGVEDFVLISTDKAVRPTNVMGATKRLAELILQGLDASQQVTRFSMVRFGNVLGSSGSVVPLFREQIRHGGPVTITHANITRYFMTIPEAAQLVVQASTMAEGGEVFVLDMGEPVLIRDLASNMIKLCGLTVRSADNPEGDIEIAVVGMRPGEKLYEELLIGNDPRLTAHPRIMMAMEHHLPWEQLRNDLQQLERLITLGQVAQARDLLSLLVSEYRPASDIVDWITIHGKGELAQLEQ